MKSNMYTVSLDTMIDKHIGIRGTATRDAFENKLAVEINKINKKEKADSPDQNQ